MTEKLILLVDDHPDIIRVLGKQIKTAFPNYTILIAANGQKAYEVAIKRLPDLIVMDWEMPMLSGIETTRKLQERADTAGIPIIIAIGRMTSSENLQEALTAGAIDYVRKPIDFTELYARMNTAFRIKEQEQIIKELLQNEIDLKTRQLTSTSMLVMEKSKVLESHVNSLVTIEKELLEGIEKPYNDSIKSGLQKLKKLHTTLYNKLKIDDSWLDFKTHFEEVHPNFFEKLRALHNKASYKDLRLCAYIRLGMDMKEMAKL